MKISWRKETNEDVIKMVDEQLYKIPTIKKKPIFYLGHIIRHHNIHRLILEGSLVGKITGGRPRTEWMEKHQRIDGNDIRRPRETGSRLGAMESHDSPKY